MHSPGTVRFRHSQSIWLAALIAFLGALPLAGARWFLAPVLLIPLAVGAWAWRAGTDADRDGVRIRALLSQRRIGWTEIVELAGDPRGRALARLSDGRTYPLPAVRAVDLPRLVAASGQPLTRPGEARPGEPATDTGEPATDTGEPGGAGGPATDTGGSGGPEPGREVQEPGAGSAADRDGQ